MATKQSLFDQFSALIQQPVCVQLQDGSASYGVLYCIDPETDHVALLCPTGQEDANYSAKIVMAHYVKRIEKDESGDLPTLTELQEELGSSNSNAIPYDVTGIERRRELLELFLTKNFVPFQHADDGSLCLFGGAATLCAPFDTVQCANEQLLRRLQQLLVQFNQQQETPTDS